MSPALAGKFFNTEPPGKTIHLNNQKQKTGNICQGLYYIYYMLRLRQYTLTLDFPGVVVKNLPAMQETRVQSLGREDPLEKEMATHSSLLAW